MWPTCAWAAAPMTYRVQAGAAGVHDEVRHQATWRQTDVEAESLRFLEEVERAEERRRAVGASLRCQPEMRKQVEAKSQHMRSVPGSCKLTQDENVDEQERTLSKDKGCERRRNLILDDQTCEGRDDPAHQCPELEGSGGTPCAGVELRPGAIVPAPLLPQVADMRVEDSQVVEAEAVAEQQVDQLRLVKLLDSPGAADVAMSLRTSAEKGQCCANIEHSIDSSLRCATSSLEMLKDGIDQNSVVVCSCGGEPEASPTLASEVVPDDVRAERDLDKIICNGADMGEAACAQLADVYGYKLHHISTIDVGPLSPSSHEGDSNSEVEGQRGYMRTLAVQLASQPTEKPSRCEPPARSSAKKRPPATEMARANELLLW